MANLNNNSIEIVQFLIFFRNLQFLHLILLIIAIKIIIY